MRPSSLLIIASLGIFMMLSSGVIPFAHANNYVSGNPTEGTGTVAYPLELYYSYNLSSAYSSHLNSWIGNVVSIAGAKNSCFIVCNKISSGWIYQAPVTLECSSCGSAGDELTTPEVWTCSGTSCSEPYSPTAYNLGTYHQVTYVYGAIFFNGNGSQITFYYQAQLHSGSTSYKTYVFYLIPNSDPDITFQAGVPSGGNTEYHLQAGVESASVQPSWTSTYNDYLSDLCWYTSFGGSETCWNSSGWSAYVTQGNAAWISDDGSTSGHQYLVGGSQYSNATAYYYDYSHSYREGEIVFYAWTGSGISTGTKLWP